MVAALDYCLHGRGGAAPSIDTAMHGLVDAVHVDHLHPDSAIAVATAADGEQLTKAIYGDRVLWVPWRRPGFQLGLDIAAIKRDNPGICRRRPRRPRHHGVGREQRRGRGELAVDDRRGAGLHRRAPRRPPLRAPGAVSRAAFPSPSAAPWRPDWHPLLRGLASTDRRVVGHFRDDDVVLEFLAGEKLPRLAGLGTSCPDHFLRTKVRPLVVDVAPTAPLDEFAERLPDAARGVPRGLRRLLPPARRRLLTAPCAARIRPSSSSRASGCTPSARTSRRPAWPASSTSTPST